MKIGRSLFMLALVAGSASAMAADDLVMIEKHVANVVPTSVNGVPYKAVFNNRSTPVTVYDNSVGPFFSTTSTPRRAMLDDMQFTAVPAGYIGATDPVLGATGPLPNGNILTDQFAVGFTYDGGNSNGAALPDVGILVSMYDQDMPNTLDTPVNDPAKLIGSFGVVFRNLPAQTGNVIFTSALFSILDANSNPVRYYIPNGTVAFSYTYLKESVAGSGTFDIPATAYTAGFAAGTTTTNGEGNVGPVIGGSAALYMRDTEPNGNFTQPPDVNEYRVFAQPNNANFWFQVTGACAVDFDGDDFPTGDDFDAYVAAFELGDISSDFDGDGFVTGDDFDKFVAAFEKGC